MRRPAWRRRPICCRARAGTVHERALAEVRARINIAVQLDRLGRTSEAIEALRLVISERPSRPFGATARAELLLQRLASRAQ